MMAKKKVVAVIGGMSIAAVRTHALEMLALADAAEEAGQAVVESASLVSVLQKLDDVARDDLVAAINESKSAGKVTQ